MEHLATPEKHLAIFLFRKRLYHTIDVALDAFPYNGGTTTSEAIWQGVPTLAIDGDRWASRTSATLLRNGRLGQYVLKSREDYVETAVQIGGDPSTPAALSVMRREMRDQLRQSPVCDTVGMARSFESMLVEIWKLTAAD